MATNPSFPLVLRAGAQALAHLRQHGLRAEDIDILPGASGGAKWLAIAGLDRFVFGEFLAAPRTRPLHAIGSSIGSWRMACLAQRDPLAALARGHEAYIHHQRYSSRPDADEVTRVLAGALDHLLGPSGVDEILSHPTVRVHIVTAASSGAAASPRRAVLAGALATSALANMISRRTLAWQFRRVIHHNAGDATPFAALRDLPTELRTVTRETLRDALLASGSIPLLLRGVRLPDDPHRVHWDGGVTDYHLDLDYGDGDGLVLFPHFYPHVVPGWFDKRLRWRRGRARHFRRTLLIAPSPAFVASLPGGKIPDRRDFYALDEADRIRRWEQVRAESERLGDTLRELIARERLLEHVRPWQPRRASG